VVLKAVVKYVLHPHGSLSPIENQLESTEENTRRDKHRDIIMKVDVKIISLTV
jgi:hypothetical protein